MTSVEYRTATIFYCRFTVVFNTAQGLFRMVPATSYCVCPDKSQSPRFLLQSSVPHSTIYLWRVVLRLALDQILCFPLCHFIQVVMKVMYNDFLYILCAYFKYPWVHVALFPGPSHACMEKQAGGRSGQKHHVR